MADSNGNAEARAVGKQELIRRIAERAGKSRKETTDILEATLDSIRDSLKNGEEVRLVGFGSFKVRTSAERTGVNPQTRERITVGPKQRVRFAPGKELNDAVAGR